ncbi:MAG: decaprenyl-phosphate phosphoribosyltransferase [Caldilineales bacterium]|nr:decaprenyl-phosphate phosphoribosyltransferase [Caldilineales bacterium]
MSTLQQGQGDAKVDDTRPTLGFQAKELFRAMRPRQWSKNVVVFAALIFDGKFLEPGPLLRTVAAFVIFCLVSSAVYLLNDLADIEKDRAHPTKRFRPLPAGTLKPGTAIVAMAALLLLTIPASFFIDWALGVIVITYFLINVAYSFYLKHVVIIDAMAVAAGFVLRVGAGAVVVEVERFSPWLYVCVTMIALLIALGKRRAELVELEMDASNHRAILDEYTLPFLDQLIAILTAATVVSYSFYTFSATNLPDNHLMMLTIPFVVYFLFRYLYLIHVRKLGGAPDELLFKDRHLFFTAVAWGLFAMAVLYLSNWQ